MSTIQIVEIRYDAQSQCMDYRASLRIHGGSISISARAKVLGARASQLSLHGLAKRHAAAKLREPSASGYRIDTPT